MSDTDTAQLQAAATLRSATHTAGKLSASFLRAMLVEFMQAQGVPALVAAPIADRAIAALVAEIESAAAPHVDASVVRIDAGITLEK